MVKFCKREVICRCLEGEKAWELSQKKGGKKMKYSRIVVFVMLFALFVAFPLVSYSKDKIVIGMSTSLTGPLAIIRSAGFQPIYEMWVDEVNKAGGIYVKEYNKKLPIELKIYDDKSDVGTMTRLIG